MKTGIELITQERKEQIEKHGRTVAKDVRFNDCHQLTHAASLLCMPNPTHTPETDQEPPFEWDAVLWEKMLNKDYKDRLIIAGALIAAEIDRLQNE